MSLTLQQCKDKVATNHGYKDWNHIDWYAENFALSSQGCDDDVEDIFYQEAAELYRQSASEWISVKERLPECETKDFYNCLVYIANGVRNAMYNPVTKNFLNGSFSCFENVTHWQPLPKPPKI